MDLVKRFLVPLVVLGFVVAAAVSFLGNAQEFPAIVLAELHIEMFALNLQFFRLDDVIHLCLQPLTLPQPIWGMEEKSTAFFGNFLGDSVLAFFQ